MLTERHQDVADVDKYIREILAKLVAADPQHPRHDRWKELQKDELTRLEEGAMRFVVKAKPHALSTPQPATDDALVWSDELLEAEFDDVDWVVKNLLGPRLYIVAGRPKLGKSWFAMQLLRDVRTGQPSLGNEGENQNLDQPHLKPTDQPLHSVVLQHALERREAVRPQ